MTEQAKTENMLLFDGITDIQERLLKIEQLLSKQITSTDQFPTRSVQINELYAALAKAQGEMKPALLSAENPYFKSRYADLTSLVESSRSSLTKYGLSITQQILYDDNGSTVLYTVLAHSSGQFIASRMKVIPPKSDIQTMGSHLTYLRRFSYASLVGIVTQDEDDDGEVAVMSERGQYNTKGVSVKYDATQKDNKYETISKDQLDELNYELADPIMEDFAAEIMDKMRIQSLADMPKAKYRSALERVREIKNLRMGNK